jgi:hypothetical protein
MMKRNLVIAVTVVMNMVAFGQSFSAQDAAELSGMNFDWSAKTVKAAPAAKTTTRTVSVRQLASASSRRSNTTARRAAAAAPAAQSYSYSAPQNVVPQNDVQAQLNSAIAANSAQRVVIGSVEHNYIEGDGTTTLIVRTAGFGGGIKKFTMRNYYDVVIPVYAGDYVCFIATYGMNGMNGYPIVEYSQLVNVTGTNRYLHEYAEHAYGGDYTMMLANTPGASKWQRTLSTITTGAMTVASVAMLAKEVISWFK